MHQFSNVLFWTVVVMAIGAGVVLLRNVTDRENRERRRRQRSHGRVVSKASRPMINLAVDVETKKPGKNS